MSPNNNLIQLMNELDSITTEFFILLDSKSNDIPPEVYSQYVKTLLTSIKKRLDNVSFLFQEFYNSADQLELTNQDQTIAGKDIISSFQSLCLYKVLIKFLLHKNPDVIVNTCALEVLNLNSSSVNEQLDWFLKILSPLNNTNE